jgi:hypothetical protein
MIHRVIPGRAKGANPESRSWCKWLDSGFASVARAPE